MDYTKRRMSEQPRVDIEDLTEQEINIYSGGVYRNYKGEPFTGFAIELDYSTGEEHMLSEKQYVNGEDIGWLITYHDNGMVKDETLNLGATSVYYVDYDEEGNCLGDSFQADKKLLEELCKIIGEDPKNVKPLELK